MRNELLDIPSSDHAERSVLGVILNTESFEIAKERIEQIPASYIHDLRHIEIAKVLRALVKKGIVPDTGVVRTELSLAKMLDAIGGDAYLSEVAGCGVPTTFDAQVGALKEMRDRRVTLGPAQALVAHALDTSKEFTPQAYAEAISTIAAASGAAADDIAEAKPLSAFIHYKQNDPSELLRDRFLCRGGGLLLVGPTGVGKSSLAMQAMISWAIGKPLFGIMPARPLRSLLIQAENDDGDIAEQRDGAIAGMGLTPEEIALALKHVVVVRVDTQSGEAFCKGTVGPLLKMHGPDLLWIDPALAYIGGEASSQGDVGKFLRNWLNPLIHRHGCGVVIIHHTNKPPSGQEKPNWQAGELAYLGSGSAEWANWARAVIALRGKGSHEVFELCAGKRGGRLGWREADGSTRAYSKMIAHSRVPGAICWREADADEIPVSGGTTKKPFTSHDIMPHVPSDGQISKEMVVEKSGVAGIGQVRAKQLINIALEEKLLHEWTIRRPGVRPKVFVCRRPQPASEII